MPSQLQRKNHLDTLAVTILLACCLLWGFQQVMVKATLEIIPPVLQAAWRFALATAVLLVWCKWRGVRLFDADGTLKSGLFVSLLFALEFACLYLGLANTSATRLTLFLYTAPFWVAVVLPWFIPAERMRTSQWIGLLCAFIAVAFALNDASGKPTVRMTAAWNFAWGDVLGIVSGVFWGLTTVVIRSTKLVTLAPEKLLFYQIAGCAPVLFVLSFVLGEPWAGQLAKMTAFAYVSMSIQVVLGAFASYLVWMWMLTRYPATKLSGFAFLTPVFALIGGNLWLGEPITTGLLAALALVAVGIVLINRR